MSITQAAEVRIGENSISETEREAGLAELAEAARTAIDAGWAEMILVSVSTLADAQAGGAAIPAPAPDLRWRLGSLPAAPAPGPGLAGQTTQQVGDKDSVALAWRHTIDGAATLTNALNLSHASGPIEAQLAVIGNLSLAQGGPMALSYRSSTKLALVPHVTVGADAWGTLGTFKALRPGSYDGALEPHLQLSLPVLGAVAGATTGWRVPTGPSAANDPDKRTEFHWKLTFRKSL